MDQSVSVAGKQYSAWMIRYAGNHSDLVAICDPAPCVLMRSIRAGIHLGREVVADEEDPHNEGVSSASDIRGENRHELPRKVFECALCSDLVAAHNGNGKANEGAVASAGGRARPK